MGFSPDILLDTGAVVDSVLSLFRVFSLNEKRLIVLAIFLGASPGIFWLWFYYKKGYRRATERKALAILFLAGIAVVIPAYILEISFFSFLPAKFSAITQGFRSVEDTKDLLVLLAVLFFFAAPVEELLKFIPLRAVIFRPGNTDQIVDGIKYGIVVGLGFAVLENAFYFTRLLASNDYQGLAISFILRFFVSTLAHSLYSGVLGYYLALARFHPMARRQLVSRGIITAVLVHGLFNLSLFVNAAYYSIFLMGIMLLVLLKWFTDRRNVEINIVRGALLSSSFTNTSAIPFLGERIEGEGMLKRGGIGEGDIKTLSFCPKCLTRNRKGSRTCLGCGERL